MFFLFVGQTQYLFGGSNFFVNIHRWVTPCFDCKFISFQKKNNLAVPTILHVNLFLRPIFKRFSILCGPKNCRRSTEFCLGSANDLECCNAIWRFWASLIVNNLCLCSKYHSKLNPSDHRIFSVSGPQILVLFS